MSLDLSVDLPDPFDENCSQNSFTEKDISLQLLEQSTRSILKPSNIDNLIVLNTPVHKNLKVSFAPTPAKPTPLRCYDDIRVLDEEENWVERTSVLTKQEHLEYLDCARLILEQLIRDCIPPGSSIERSEDNPAQPIQTNDSPGQHRLSVELAENGTHSEDSLPDAQFNTSTECVLSESVADNPGQPIQTDNLVQHNLSVETLENEPLPQESLPDAQFNRSIGCDLRESSTTSESPQICSESPVAISQETAGSAAMSDSPPLPARGAYNIDWDNFDESAFNPFSTGKALSNSPPRSDPSEVATKPVIDENDNTHTVSLESPPRKVTPTKKSPKKKKTKSSPAKQVPKEIVAPVNPVEVMSAVSLEDAEAPAQHDPPLGDSSEVSTGHIQEHPAVEAPGGDSEIKDSSLVGCAEQKPALEGYTCTPVSSSDDTDSGIVFKVPAVLELPSVGDGDTAPGYVDGQKGIVKQRESPEENYDTAEEGMDDFDEEFKPASEVFGDAAAFDMLEKFGGGDGSQPSKLSRESLYVKFDPLVGGTVANTNTSIPAPVAVPPSLLKTLETLQENDDLLLMNTPEKTPAKPHVERDIANKTIDRLFDISPAHPNQASAGGESGRDTPSLMSSATEEIVKVCKYSDADLDEVRRTLEMDFQSRLLAKERDWDKKLRDKETHAAVLSDQVTKLTESNVQMKKIVSDYETTINQLIVDNESKSSASQESLTDLVKERDQALSDLDSVEKAFSDLHRRYEKLKEAIDGFKKNEEILKKCVEDHQGRIKKWEQKYAQLKQHAEEKLDVANEEIDKVKKSTTSDMARLQAALKRAEIQTEGLERSLEQKVKENKELAAICDELISKVGDGN